ncbi:hypothetical protein I302_101934 [Kwoniella bestiolae CBS 10118]|uniref:TPR repeat-containing protein n=1 Tax=Kwoniella bestiolae CBS 10118 TaxID=1296100 RepID=A0A1B9GDP4_9TREE|nr:hypothetical protein I302_00618 [Kwoniella bestiolae CBS 10118]OCF29123.1 hypothetical protein I302_00618 [Kwoniella bestiolae CBS 10118]
MSRIASSSLIRSTTIARSAIANPTKRAPVAVLSHHPTPSPIAHLRRWNTTGPTSTGHVEQPGADQQENQDAKSSSARLETGGKGGLKISWIFSGLAGLGALVTIYGLLEFYSTLKTWPKAVRVPLRAALKAKLNQDYRRSEQYFREALEVALALGPSALEPEPLQKITGIYVELANVLELMGQRVTAFEELRNAVELLGPNPIRQPGVEGSGEWIGRSYKLSEKDHIRAIGLYQKLGQISLEISNSSRAPSYTPSRGSEISTPTGKTVESWNEASEYYLSTALTAMLKLGLNRSPSPIGAGSTGGEQVVLGRDVDLPSGEISEDATQGGSVDKRGLGMTMESLSEVYAKKGQYDLAAQLLLQAVSILLPPGSQGTPPVRDRCQAAMLMTTISSHALKQSSTQKDTAKSIKISKSWSLRSLQLSEEALRESEAENYKDSPYEASIAICSRAKSVGLYNMGMLAEMEGDLPTALNLFQKSLTASRETGFSEGKREAAAAIRRVQSLGGPITS